MFVEIRKLGEVDQRVETGPTQFGDDWPGTFIRGDDSANFAYHLRDFLSEAESCSELSHMWLQIAVLRGLLGTLSSSNLNERRAELETSAAPVECDLCKQGRPVDVNGYHTSPHAAHAWIKCTRSGG